VENKGDLVKKIAVDVLNLEAESVKAQIKAVNDKFVEAVEILQNTKGRVIITGMGKSGIICKKIAATMASTGTPAFFVHPAEAIHGDLGMIVEGDSVIAVSNTGETEEIVRLIEFIKRIGVPVIGITSNINSSLGRFADITLELKIEKEACPLGLAPTSSTTATLALLDAISMALLELKEFKPEDFAARHPGGGLGKKLLTVDALMHKGDAIPKVHPDTSMQDVLFEMSGKRLGMTTVVDKKTNKLLGLISDGDIRRYLEKHGNSTINHLAENCMTKNPLTIKADKLAAAALKTMEDRKITSLIVVNEKNEVEGVIHLHDLWKTQLF
jgi:arabinose-5-phosphate isomerase